jgi:hypothetical protein
MVLHAYRSLQENFRGDESNSPINVNIASYRVDIRRRINMRLNENEVNNYLQAHLGQYEDSLQQAWVEIVERNPETLDDVALIARKIKNKAIKQYLTRKFREKSLYEPVGKNRGQRFTLESILANPANETAEEEDDGSRRLYYKVVNFLISEYISQKEENVALKRQEIDLKAERLRLREEALKFQRDRFESWKRLMEEKGKEKENRLKLKIQLQREQLEFRKARFAPEFKAQSIWEIKS